MYDGKLRLVLVAAAMVLIIVALVGVGVFNIILFKKSYEDSLSRSYQVAIFPAKRNIEYALRYGKPLSHFFGMEELLQKIENNIPEVEELNIVQPDGKILYDRNGAVTGKSLPSGLIDKIGFVPTGSDANMVTVFLNDKYHYLIPLKDKDNQLAGFINMALPKSVIHAYVDENMWKLLQSTVVVGITSLNFLVFILFAVPIFDTNGGVRKKRLITTVITVFLLANVGYTTLSASLFSRSYETLTAKNMAIMLQSIGDDINSVLAKGVVYEDLTGIDDYLGKIIAGSPDIGDIAISDGRGQILYHILAAEASGNRSENSMVSRDLLADRSGVSGTITIILSQAYIYGNLKSIVLSSLVVTGCFLSFIPFAMLKFVHLLPQIKTKLMTREGYSG